MVLTLAAAITWYCLPLPQLTRTLQSTRQFLQQAQLHPEQTWVCVLLKFEPLREVFRRTL
ncbi:MAG: hypothetical protein ACRERZ_00670 [Gammaproteobacteria bacterium]